MFVTFEFEEFHRTYSASINLTQCLTSLYAIPGLTGISFVESHEDWGLGVKLIVECIIKYNKCIYSL